MSNIELNLPADLQQFVENHVAAGNYGQASEFIETLLATAKRQEEELESQLLLGLDSGDAIPLDADEWRSIRKEVNQRLVDGS